MPGLLKMLTVFHVLRTHWTAYQKFRDSLETISLIGKLQQNGRKSQNGRKLQCIYIDVATRCAPIVHQHRRGSSTLTPNSSCQLHVLGHNCDALRVDRTQICIFKPSYQVGLRCFLKCTDGLGLEPQVRLKD